ncbi:MAG: GTPase [Peptoniphilus sp.]|nr:GTPase [Peptoniphilus sp.]MDD7362796.1 50S ribosome-binding GTPase [Bacillota bacterium]MDY6044012.1 GTPase [Peptoniphilus sp.]
METAKGLRTHIAIFGKTNSGKSTLMNLLTDQETSMVSDEAGTTTDPVYKNMEIDGIGAATLIDTAGFSDDTALGDRRMDRTRKVAEEIDAAIALEGVEDTFLESLHRRNIPVLHLSYPFPAKDEILKKLSELLEEKEKIPGLLDGLDLGEGRFLLVMPQDESAPKGRLILPQVQTMRELLDAGYTATISTLESMDRAIESLHAAPDWIITDSQVFSEVYAKKPRESKITSFSILFARAKGDERAMIDGANYLFELGSDAKILMSEACTHAPKEEDIGRVKIPRMLKKKLGDSITIDFSRGLNFPDDVGDYDVVIMCGSCMFQRPVVQSRIRRALESGVRVTNYGMVIAAAKGILDKIDF